MHGALAIPPDLEALRDWTFAGLERVSERIDTALASDIPAVAQLCRHVERYRGKMLRPTLALLCGAATGDDGAGPPAEALVTVAAVVEIVHMATLVHDDVLDDATIRRGGETISSLSGNETAVILGDYLIASAYHLCSGLDSPEPARIVGRVSRQLCAGELLQLSNRDNLSLDEATYFEILAGKTASLVGGCCALGGLVSGGDPERCAALETYGRRVGAAFQVQDDVLDLTGDERVVGKTLGQDLRKGKLTLPLIHHLAVADPRERGRSLALLEAVSETGGNDTDSASTLISRLAGTGSVAYARDLAAGLVREAVGCLDRLGESDARRTLRLLADAVLTRDK
jgi:octaprenyl-diphosphate synthase